MPRAVAAFLFPFILFGQTPSGTIRVDVKDPSGAPIEAAGKLTGPRNVDHANGVDCSAI